MVIDKVMPSEATFTNAVRLASVLEDLEMAFDTVKQMKGFEPELSALLRISAVLGNADKVYGLLHRLRTNVKQGTEPTVGIIEDRLKSEHAVKVGKENWDVSKIKEGVVRGGGGWHGQG
ncbi:unnamed protein product [Dovyalis caffra]|uniref:PROP1-like PPR domain-containing protein n=1 Tax=Dovyalis caffra TaxID=77055 RepID=A0AAV1RSQ8_9ROSI|nr:unnamed protein product [Dovyalis caffra]